VSSIRILQVFVALGTATLLVASVGAAAEDSNHNGIPDSLEESTARNVLLHASTDGFFIHSKSIGAAQDDAFEVSCTQGLFTVGYARVAGEPDNVSYTLEFKSLAEVILLPSGAVADRVGDPVDLSPGFTIEAIRTTASDGTVLSGFKATTDSGLFTVRVWSAERFARVGDGLVSPAEVKIDLEIRGWMFQRADTGLALGMEIWSPAGAPEVNGTSQDAEHGWASNESQVNVVSGGDTAFFSWSRSAVVGTVNPIRRPVYATSVEQETGTEYAMSLVYDLGPHPVGNAATVVAHDPKMGAVSQAFWSIWNQPAPLQPNVALYTVGIVVMAAAVGVTVIAVRRRRGSP
jgi:hypothetical protein